MEPESETEFMIYGVGEPKEPKIKIINSPSNEYDGLYEYKTRGSSGDIYVNEEKNIVIKINHQPQEKEVENQLSVNDLAPKIYWHQYPYTIYMNGTEDIANTDSPYEEIGVIIMEYLNPNEWVSINDNRLDSNQSFALNDEQIWTLLDALYKLLVTYKLINYSDMIGVSGPHIFIKRNKPYEVKFIDYEYYENHASNDKMVFKQICTILSNFIIPRWRFLEKVGEYILKKWNSKKTSRKTKLGGVGPRGKAKGNKSKKHKKKKTKRKKKRKSKKSKMR